MEVATFVAVVLQLISVTSKVVKYVSDVERAPKDQAKLLREATGLLALFADLTYRVEGTTSTDPWFDGLRSLGRDGRPMMEFKNAMEDVTKKLVPTKGVVNLRKVLSWTLDKKGIEAFIGNTCCSCFTERSLVSFRNVPNIFVSSIVQ